MSKTKKPSIMDDSSCGSSFVFGEVSYDDKPQLMAVECSCCFELVTRTGFEPMNACVKGM